MAAAGATGWQFGDHSKDLPAFLFCHNWVCFGVQGQQQTGGAAGSRSCQPGPGYSLVIVPVLALPPLLPDFHSLNDQRLHGVLGPQESSRG